MKCIQCGTENAEGSRFCGSCGQPLMVTCSTCGQAVPATNKFCPSCGARMAAAKAPAVEPFGSLASGGQGTPSVTATVSPAYAAPAATTPSTPPRFVAPNVASQPIGAPPPPAGLVYGPPAAASLGGSGSYPPSAPPPAVTYSPLTAAPAAGAANSAGWARSDGYTYPASGVMAPMPFAYKGVGPRFVAALLDGIIVGIPSYLLMSVLFRDQMMRMAYGSRSAMAGPYLFMVIIGLVYSVLLEAGGGTLGKRIMGMRIVDAQGNKPGLGKALVRNLLRIIDMIPGFYLVGIIAVASSTTKQRVGDKAAGTFVVSK